MHELIDGEVIDTQGGYTWRDVWYEKWGEEITIFEKHYGNKPLGTSVIDDPEEIKEFMSRIIEIEKTLHNVI